MLDFCQYLRTISLSSLVLVSLLWYYIIQIDQISDFNFFFVFNIISEEEKKSEKQKQCHMFFSEKYQQRQWSEILYIYKIRTVLLI